MLLSELLKEVEPQWHQAFVTFIERGDADDDFLAYLDSSEACQRAVERAFSERAAKVQRLVQAVHGASEWNAQTASACIIQAIEKTAVSLPREESVAAFRQVAEGLQQRVPTFAGKIFCSVLEKWGEERTTNHARRQGAQTRHAVGSG